MGFGARAMVHELSGTLDALQDKPEPIGHALELQESQKNTFPGYSRPSACRKGFQILDHASGEQLAKERPESVAGAH